MLFLLLLYSFLEAYVYGTIQLILPVPSYSAKQVESSCNYFYYIL